MLRPFSRFHYVEPASTEEVLTLLRDHPMSVIKAGGTDLLIRMRRGEIDPDLVINIRRIQGIHGVTPSKEAGVSIGSNATMDELAGTPLASAWNAVTDAAGRMGTPQIRNLATVGGNVCNRSPVADVAAALVAYDAMGSVESQGGREVIPVEALVKHPGRVPLFLTRVTLPPLRDRTVGSFLKCTRTGGDGLAIVSCALVVTVDPSTSGCTRARIVFGGVGPSLMSPCRAEDALASSRVNPGSIDRACDAVERDIHPIDDFRAGAEYRIHLAKVLLKRSWSHVLQRLGSYRAM